MSGYKLVGIFLMVVIFESVAALECYSCLGFEKCLGNDANHIEQCNSTNADLMSAIATAYFPKLQESLDKSTFQCAWLVFTPAGTVYKPDMLKGCIYGTNTSLCRMDSTFPSGNFSCRACNTDKCNSGVTLGWSLMLLMIGLAATRLIK